MSDQVQKGREKKKLLKVSLTKQRKRKRGEKVHGNGRVLNDEKAPVIGKGN